MDMNEQTFKLNSEVLLENMAQIAKISGHHVQLKSCGHKFYEVLKNKIDCLFQLFPEIYKSYEVVEGNGFAHGSVIHLKYDIGGKLAEAKERIAVDDANKTVTLEVIEGDLLKDFEVFKLKVKVFDNGSNGSSVNWTIEFVKANEDVAPPYNFLPLLAKVSKGLDDYICNN